MADSTNMNSNSSLNSISSNSSNNSECFICNEERAEPAMSLLDYEINRTCGCAAKLHGQCYSQWLSQSATCPICRNPILPDTIISVIAEDSEPIPETTQLRENNQIENNQIENNQNNYGVCIIIIYTSIIVIIISLIAMISIM